MKKLRRGGKLLPCAYLCCVFLATSGCLSFDIRDYDVQALSSPKIPLRVGLYMSPEFRTYRRFSYGPEALGDGMRRGAEQAIQRAFEEVVMIDSLSSAEIPRRAIKVIASPEIVRAGIIQERGFRLTYGIACKWTMWSADGKVVYMDTFSGEGVDSSFTAKTRISTAMTLAAKEQYDKFLVHVMSNKWWEAIK